MPWYAWALVAWFSLATVVRVGSTGRTLELEPSGAAISVVGYALVIWAIVAHGRAAG